MNNNYFEKWQYYKRGILSSEADYINVPLTKDLTKSLFKRWPKAFYIRSVSDFDKKKQGDFYSVIKDGDMNIDTLPAKTRNMVRRCLKNCSVELVDYQRIVDGGGIISICQS